MDKLAKYRKIVREIVERYGRFQSSVGNVETYAVCDEHNDNYLVIDVGWLAFGRQHAMPLHIRLKNNQVWVEWDGTDQEIVQQLIDSGVDENDIVLGFEQPQEFLKAA
jgi:XisI protein